MISATNHNTSVHFKNYVWSVHLWNFPFTILGFGWPWVTPPTESEIGLGEPLYSLFLVTLGQLLKLSTYRSFKSSNQQVNKRKPSRFRVCVFEYQMCTAVCCPLLPPLSLTFCFSLSCAAVAAAAATLPAPWPHARPTFWAGKSHLSTPRPFLLFLPGVTCARPLGLLRVLGLTSDLRTAVSRGLSRVSVSPSKFQLPIPLPAALLLCLCLTLKGFLRPAWPSWDTVLTECSEHPGYWIPVFIYSLHLPCLLTMWVARLWSLIEIIPWKRHRAMARNHR